MATSVVRRRTCRTLAVTGFLLLIIGITYFAILVFSVRFAAEETTRAAAFVDLADFLSGSRGWYENATVYSAGSLALALTSLLFGVHPLSRITLPIAVVVVVALQVYGEEIRVVIAEWARRGAGA